MMHGRRVGIAVSHLLQLLLEVCPIQSELGPESLHVWTEARVQVWSRPKAQKDHWQPTLAIIVVLAVAGNGIFERPMPADHYTLASG